MRNSPVDYSPLSIFQHADPIVQGIILGLLFASIISWSIMIDRMVRVRSELVKMRILRDQVANIKGPEGLLEICAQVPSAGARILYDMHDEWVWSLSLAQEGYDQIRARLTSVADLAVARENAQLSGATSLLATIGSIAPFVGLFGTVWGIMRSFMSIGQSQNTSLAVVAPGISEALMATAIGLFCAIPAVIGYNRLLHALGDAGEAWRAICGQLEIVISRQFGSNGR